MIMEQNQIVIDENNNNKKTRLISALDNGNDQKTLENNNNININNNKQIILFSPNNILNNILNNNNKNVVIIDDDDDDDDEDINVNAKEIVPISVSKPISNPNPLQSVPLLAPRVVPTVGQFTVQCAECFKWRLIPTKEKYERIREHIVDQPFKCELAKEWREGITCAVPADLKQDGSRLWAIDKPSIAQPPTGWQRELRIRGEGSSKFADVYYISPTGKRMRSMIDIQKYFLENPELLTQGTTMSQFSFQTPKPLQENYVKKRLPRSNAPTSGETAQASPLCWAAPENSTGAELGGPVPSDSFSKGTSNDAISPAKTKSRLSSERTVSDESFNTPKRFKINGPSAPANEVHDL